MGTRYSRLCLSSTHRNLLETIIRRKGLQFTVDILKSSLCTIKTAVDGGPLREITIKRLVGQLNSIKDDYETAPAGGDTESLSA
jgi:hypothetical protein